ncbi:hypothetical protein [Salinigranum salinum]|uniref:hypothetical protein n=1 Tax=Salinigranum salinum TaxID=1364937 RepID=UPI0012609330|nr:hypothetical protein [Salinigranum salinum]
MERREYLRAAALLLGTGVAGTATARTDDESLYDSATEPFDDVTRSRPPESQEDEGRAYLRLYDADSETVAYAVSVEETDELALAVRDASGTELAA